MWERTHIFYVLISTLNFMSIYNVINRSWQTQKKREPKRPCRRVKSNPYSTIFFIYFNKLNANAYKQAWNRVDCLLTQQFRRLNNKYSWPEGCDIRQSWIMRLNLSISLSGPSNPKSCKLLWSGIFSK